MEFGLRYSEVLGVVIKGVKREKRMCKRRDEVGGLWNIVNGGVEMGEVKKEEELKIKRWGSVGRKKVRIEKWGMGKRMVMIGKEIRMGV